MTLRELMVNYVLAAMNEKPSELVNYAQFYVGLANSVLCSLWQIDRQLKKQRGKEDLGEFAPLGAADEVPLETDLLLDCAIWGIACRLRADDAADDGATLGLWESNYNEGKARFTQGRYCPVKSVRI